LRDAAAKEWLETSLLRALHRCNAAAYYAGRVGLLVQEREAAALRSAKDRAEDVPPRPGMVATFRLRSTSVDDLLFDVDAFLAAARSCLDFAASVIAPHLGMDRRTSMTTLLKSHMNVTHCSFAVLPRWREWITQLMAYRDTCVDHVTLRAASGHELVYENGTVVCAMMPIGLEKVISKSTRDTRSLRHAVLQEDVSKGLERRESQRSITLPDGPKVTRRKITYAVAPGYVRVERFCEDHHRQLERFLVDLLNEAAQATFKTTS
jgi:hypothetical protein